MSGALGENGVLSFMETVKTFSILSSSKGEGSLLFL